jgi:hypothetical protein
MSPVWTAELATLCCGVLTYCNWQRLPRTEEDWLDVASRLGVDLEFVDRGRASGVLLDNIAVIRRARDASETNKRAAHELAEYLLRSEWEPPYIVPPDADRHAIARLVERML